MTDPENPIDEEAIAWFVKLERDDASPSDWDAFTVWLEQNPRHAAAYDRVVAGDVGLSQVSAAKPEHDILGEGGVDRTPASDNQPC